MVAEAGQALPCSCSAFVCTRSEHASPRFLGRLLFEVQKSAESWGGFEVRRGGAKLGEGKEEVHAPGSLL
jgi:hypothetical protein